MNFSFRHDACAHQTLVASRLARIEIMHRFEDAEKPWRALIETGAIQSPYQRYEWVTLWNRHVAEPNGEQPLVVAGYDEVNRPVFIWPLIRRNYGPIAVASFSGGKHATLNFPAWRPDFAASLDAPSLDDILHRVARLIPGLDILLLLHQPAMWNGLANPFALLPNGRAADDAYRLPLTRAHDAAAANIGNGTLRRLRKKEAQLSKLQGYRYEKLSEPYAVERCLDAFFSRKAAHLSALGLDNAFEKPGVESFIRDCCRSGLDGGNPLIELHTLQTDEEMLALFAGLHDGQSFTLSFNALTRGANARYSPGLVLLRHMIVDCAERGFDSFDIGPGDARYKTEFCKTQERVIDSVIPLTIRGRMIAPFIRAGLAARARFKRSPLLWKAFLAAKRNLRGRASPSDITPRG